MSLVSWTLVAVAILHSSLAPCNVVLKPRPKQFERSNFDWVCFFQIALTGLHLWAYLPQFESRLLSQQVQVSHLCHLYRGCWLLWRFYILALHPARWYWSPDQSNLREATSIEFASFKLLWQDCICELTCHSSRVDCFLNRYRFHTYVTCIVDAGCCGDSTF